ncbi:uncharacterized protein NPIL_186501 [Nephila pilipes]|uniref:Uncharacterized protein n=1 Tax=Nephila pilipes TaxID=299642 RepID=A0A8X6UDJ9_NEPPI|nr:uncharacterized protein NPIL_186501 [Nephila pilipes]
MSSCKCEKKSEVNLFSNIVVIFILPIVISIIIKVEGQSNEKDKDHLPIEMIFSPRRDITDPGGKLIQSENKAIELKIQSDSNNKGKIDVTIASKKEVQETAEESVDRYSPQYNAENDRVNDDSAEISKGDISSTKNFQTSRQDPGSLYNPSEFSDIIPFDAMRQFYEQPQSLLIGRNQFSPLQNLRHLEESLAREVLPRTLGQGFTAARNVDNAAPFGMLMTHPLYSNGFASGLDVAQRYPTNPQSFSSRIKSSSHQSPHPPQTVPSGIMVSPGYSHPAAFTQNPLPETTAMNHAEGRPV